MFISNLGYRLCLLGIVAVMLVGTSSPDSIAFIVKHMQLRWSRPGLAPRCRLGPSLLPRTLISLQVNWGMSFSCYSSSARGQVSPRKPTQLCQRVMLFWIFDSNLVIKHFFSVYFHDEKKNKTLGILSLSHRHIDYNKTPLPTLSWMLLKLHLLKHTLLLKASRWKRQSSKKTRGLFKAT